MEALGLRVATIAALAERLECDFIVQAGGFALFSDMPDPLKRAVRADETVRGAWAVAHNLMEMRLHERDLSSTVGSGLRAARTGSGAEEYFALTNVDRHIAGFFRAFGSVLDTLAAVAIGILRVPRAIERADFLDLLTLASGSKDTPSVEQQQAWDGCVALVNDHRRCQPVDWLDYALEYRNAVVHRARQLAVTLPVPAPPPTLEVVTDDPIGVQLALTRFQPHLRRRPWVPDLEDLVACERLDEVWLSEPARLTLAGLRDSLNDLTEAVGGYLLESWEKARQGQLRLVNLSEGRRSAASGKTRRGPFVGYAPVPLPPASQVVGGAFQRVRAEIIRDLRAASAGAAKR